MPSPNSAGDPWAPQTTLETADRTIGSDSILRYNRARMTRKLTEPTRSSRILPDHLEDNPYALSFSKTPKRDR